MGVVNFSGDERRQTLKARQVADVIFRQVVEPELRKVATDPANWVGTGATWDTGTQSPRAWDSCKSERNTFMVQYHTHPREAITAFRHFDMKGEVRVENKGQTLTVFVDCRAYDGRRRDPEKKESAEIPPVDVHRSNTWLVADAKANCIGQWVREQLIAFIDGCKNAQPD